MVLRDFVFFNEQSKENESNILSITDGDELVIQVNGSAVNLTVKGLVDYESENYIDVSVIGLNGYSISNVITTEGIFTIPISGLSKVKIVSGGTLKGLKVYGKVVK